MTKNTTTVEKKLGSISLYDEVPEYTEEEKKTVEAYNLVMMYLDQVRNGVNEGEGKTGSDIYTSYEGALTRYLLTGVSNEYKTKRNTKDKIIALFSGNDYIEREYKTGLEKLQAGVKFKKIFFNRIIKRLEIQDNYIPESERLKIENFIDDCIIEGENGEHFKSNPLEYVNNQYIRNQKQYIKKQAEIIGKLEMKYKKNRGSQDKKNLEFARQEIEKKYC